MESNKSKGLGDSIEKITTATGIKKVVHKIVGEDCGCNKRKNILNEKTSLFEVAVGSSTITSWGMWTSPGGGVSSTIIIPDEVYRLSQVRVGGYPVEILPTKEFNMVRESPLTAPTAKRPIARRDFKGLLIKDNTGNVIPSTHSINASYIRKPVKVEWNSLGAGLYNSTNSVDFELHDSEEVNLVIKILGLAGITLKDPGLYQIAGAEDNKNIQQEKQ